MLLPVRFRAARSLAGVLLLAVAGTAIAGTASAAGPDQRHGRRLEPPASRLNRPEAEPPFVCAQIAFGGPFAPARGNPGYGGSFIFRPPAAADFMDFLNDWNTGLVLQIDRQSLGGGGRVLSADLLLRRYFAERGKVPWSVLPFVGGGFGASSALPGRGDTTPGLKYWSLVLEAGQEWRSAGGYLLLVKGQVRLLRRDGSDWSTWSVMAGLGVPVPW